jgi:hypothetical protein
LWSAPHELARVTLEAAQRAGASDVLFPFDTAILPEAAGATIRWQDERPVIQLETPVSLADLDPSKVLGRERTLAAVEATGYLAASLPVAAHVPSPRELVRLLAGDATDEDTSESAEDLVLALLRLVLEGGASSAIVRDAGPDPPDLGAVARLAEHFAVPWFATTGPDVVMISPAHGTDPDATARALERVRGASIVLTDGPVPADVELGRFAAFAAEVARC